MECYLLSILLLLFQSLATDFGCLPVLALHKNVYKPIRIFPYFYNLNYELDKHEEGVLKETVNNVILYVKKILAVIPSEEELLLKRDACRKNWYKGRNEGKCASIKKNYVGEFCLDNFMIPDEHLEAFYTWTNKPLPDKTWYTEGKGVRNADYILYVQAMTTKACMNNYISGKLENSLIAYASYCKQGPNDRPIAGYLNICPTELRKYIEDRDKLVLVTMHEVFHALGFSKDLILDFRDYRQGCVDGECPRYSYPILRQNNGSYFLLTPAVIARMNIQFGCSEIDHELGAPLSMKDGAMQSHWDGYAFPGSIMNSKIDKKEYTFIDPITLALFGDTGWYQVNYTSGDDYVWGKRKGCDYLKSRVTKQTKSLEDSKLCSVDYKSGCNIWQTEVIRCPRTGAASHQYDDVIIDCQENMTEPFSDETKFNLVFDRCLLFKQELTVAGNCIIARCAAGMAYIKLRITDVNWLKCPFGEVIEEPVSGAIISCPTNNETFCMQREKPVYYHDLVRIEATTVTERPRRATTTTERNFYGVNDEQNHQHVMNTGCLPHALSFQSTLCTAFIILYTAMDFL